MVRRKNTVTNSLPRPSGSNTNPTGTPKKKSKPENTAVAYDNGQGIYMTRAMFKSIKRLQLSTGLLIPKLPFSLLVREIISELFPHKGSFRIQMDALKALHESCELYLTQYFEDSYMCTLHAKRTTLMVKDMQLARRLRGRQDIINH